MLSKRTFIALMIITITMIFCSISWSEPNPKQANPKSKSGQLAEQNRSKQEIQTTDIVTHQILIDAISRAIDAIAKKAKTTQNPPPPDNSPWYFSLFLVIFTGVLAVVAIFQFFVLQRTLTETQKVANAAIDSAKIAQTALHVAERAYLRIGNFTLTEFYIGSNPIVSYEIHNVGHTPAQIVESLTILDIIDKNVPKIPIYDNENFTHGPKQTFIQPDDKGSMLGARKNVVTAEEFACVQNENKIIFAWGKIIFRDVFDKMWIAGFGTVFSKTFGIAMMDGYNYTTEYKQENEQPQYTTHA